MTASAPTDAGALREALAEDMLMHEWPQHRDQLVPFAEQCASVRKHWLEKADALIAGSLASLLAARATTDADLAKAQEEIAGLKATLKPFADCYRPHTRCVSWTTIQVTGAALTAAHILCGALSAEKTGGDRGEN